MVLTPTVTSLTSPPDRSLFEFVLQEERIAVTFTSQNQVAAAWTRMFQPEHGSFFPVGVAIHCNQGSGTPQVLTLCTGNQCLVFKLNGRVTSRDLLVFLRDVSTCYGWRTAAYGDLIRVWNTRLSLARLTDIQSLLPNQEEPNMTLSHFTNMVWGQPVREPTVTNWSVRRTFNKKEIKETVLRAYICHVIGTMHPTNAPNNSLTRVISDTYPRMRNKHEHLGVTLYVVEISATEHIYVKCSDRVSVLVSWMESHLGGGYLGINPKQDLHSRHSIIALASCTETFVFKYNPAVREDGLLPRLLGLLRYYTWDTQSVERLEARIAENRVTGVRNYMPVTHDYEDLSRLVLGYELSRKRFVTRNPTDDEVVSEAVEAYVCFMAGMDFGDHDNASDSGSESSSEEE